jgi:GAF domain-containing protein
MAEQRIERVMSALRASDGSSASGRLCAICPELTGVTGAAVMLMDGDMPRGSLCVTDRVSQLIEDLQYMLGEGPCVDAYHQDSVVSEPDLAVPGMSRWPAFTPPALREGVRAVFGFPLRVGAVRIGALNLYRAAPGPLTADQHADALAVADFAARWVLDAQSEAPGDAVATELEATANFHFSVHNAAGIVSVQQAISVSEALVRLRAFAFSQDTPLADVARDIIAHRMRLP